MVLLVPSPPLIQPVPLVLPAPLDQGHHARLSLQDCLLILLNHPILEIRDALLGQEALAFQAALFFPVALKVHLFRVPHLGHLHHLFLAGQAILWDQVDLWNQARLALLPHPAALETLEVQGNPSFLQNDGSMMSLGDKAILNLTC